MFEQKCPHQAIKSAHTLNSLLSLICENSMNSGGWLAPRGGFEPPAKRLTVVSYFNKNNSLVCPHPLFKEGCFGTFWCKVPTPFGGKIERRMPMT